jgi:hypothetical protein
MATGYPPHLYEDLTLRERRIWTEEHRRMNDTK